MNKNTLTPSNDWLLVPSPETKLTKEFKVSIHPLGPLSMISSVPMDFRKTDVIPTGKMLYGMFENLLKIHLVTDARIKAIKMLKSFYGQQFDLLFIQTLNDKKFFPIIQHVLKFHLLNSQELIDNAQFFNDYGHTMSSRLDLGPTLKDHIGGSKTMDSSMSRKHLIDNIDNFTKEEFAGIIDKLPVYFTKPAIRQFVIFDVDIQLMCVSTPEMYKQLKEYNQSNKSLYLGNSESLVEVEIL